jgi:hypothetical protein
MVAAMELVTYGLLACPYPLSDLSESPVVENMCVKNFGFVSQNSHHLSLFTE